MRLNPVKVASGSIGDRAALCATLSIAEAELAQALALSSEERYRANEIPKKDGTSRKVFNPHHLIRKLQRRINTRIFANPNIIAWPDFIFGSIPNQPNTESIESRDYVNCARQHCGAKSTLSLDIKDFFDNINRLQVENIFQNFLKYPTEISKILADICCKDDQLAQGALTSSYLASLCLFEHEGRSVQRLRQKGLTYTRLVDDITVSSKRTDYNFSFALQEITSLLQEAGLPINTEKTKIQRASMLPILVHGLRIDFTQPRLPPDEPGKIRAAVHNIELLAATPGYRASRSYRKDFNRCLGRVNKLHRVGHTQHPKLIARLKKILPLASHKDIERAEQLVARLERDCAKPNYKETYWFSKRHNVASERLGILKRSFPKIAANLRQRLTAIRPPRKYD